MSDWTNADVTPVGGAAGGRAETGPSVTTPGGHDPFGARPTQRKPGWIRVVLGSLVVVGAIAMTVVGGLRAIEAGAGIEDDAVARGEVREDGEGRAVAFTVPAGERRDYSVFLLLRGRDNDEDRQELIVRDTACVAEMPDGVETAFRGARQTSATTIGDASSVGHFSSQPGRVTVFCGYSDGTRSSRRIRPEVAAYVVTPGTPGAMSIGIVMLVGGVLLAGGGWYLARWGWRRRRPV